MRRSNVDERVLVLAPIGRDAELAERTLAAAGMVAERCRDVEELCRKLGEGGGAAVLTEEALAPATTPRLVAELAMQPAWSDFPLIVLARGGEESQTGLRILEALGPHANVTLLERPVHAVTLVTATRVALRARRRHYQVRDTLAARERIEAALRQSEQYYRSLAEAMPQIVWTADPDGSLDYFNERWFDYSGSTYDEARGWGWRSFVHPDDQTVVIERWLQCIRDGTPFEVECRFRRVDGMYRWHLGRALPLRDRNGKIEKWFGTSTDIDDQRRLAEEREAALAATEDARVAADGAREAAERASRAKDEFLAVLSHELRSPLGAIRMWAGLLRGGRLDPQKRERAIEAIERNTITQAQLIEDLLDVSRVIAGKLVLDLHPVDPAAAAESALDAVRTAADAKSVRLEHDFEIGLGQIAADPARLQQIVWNLLSNAVKFSPSGGRVSLRVRRVDGHAEIVVADEGEGIAAEFLPHIFERFRQADPTSTRTHGGLGLGLAIVQHLVELHGGSITADSAGLGTGATFTVRLPLITQRLTFPEPPAGTVGLADDTDGLPLAGVRVVVVDDEREVRDSIVAVLQDGGANVRAAASATEAEGLLDDELPDVFLSDIAMPGRDGYALLSDVGARLRSGGVRAAALTAYASADDRRRALASGFDAHVAKPVDPSRLIALVADLARAARPQP